LSQQVIALIVTPGSWRLKQSFARAERHGFAADWRNDQAWDTCDLAAARRCRLRAIGTFTLTG